MTLYEAKGGVSMYRCNHYSRLNSFTALRFTMFVLILLLSGQSLADSSDQQIAKILKADKSPEGIVFEILADDSGLKWAIPKVQAYVKQLRKKWPKIKIAVVSHGDEQFALTKKNQSRFKQVHTQVKSLTADLDVSVHICGTYADMKGKAPEDFPKYVTVSTHGPKEIRSYQEFGYILVKLKRK